ncbi:MAG: M36 family metallopeptidase [Nocardioidaceae bacterium]
MLKTVVTSKQESRVKPTYVTGKARVFDPNPVVKLQNENLKDHNDADSAGPMSGYTTVNLNHLDGSHSLVGKWVRVTNSNLASSPDIRYFYLRANDKFEQVNAYQAVDVEQSYLQSLGFTDVNAEAQKVKVDAFPDDNSYYSPSTDMISMGTGGVDDAEDPEVTWHEYGHAIQDDQVPGFGSSEEAGSIGEGFGDFMAVMMSQQTGPHTSLTPTTCVMDWDATSYTSGPKHCLRTTNTHKMYPGDLTGEVHADGEIWSNALWSMDRRLGRDKATKIIIEAQFSYNPTITMPAAARVTVSTAKRLYGAQAAAQTHASFAARGIL